MRVIVIDPEVQRIEERDIEGGRASFRRIVGGRPVFGTFFNGDAVYLNDLPSYLRSFKLGDDWIAGRAVLAGLGAGRRGYYAQARSVVATVAEQVSWDDQCDCPTHVQWLNDKWMAHYTDEERFEFIIRRYPSWNR